MIASACRSHAPSSPDEIEAALQATARSVVREEGFTLFSPYEEAPTGEYAAVVREQAQLVSRLFADAGAPPVRIYLVPVAADANAGESQPWIHASRDGFEGGAFATDFAFVYVPATADAASALVRAAMGKDTLRHELAHLYARRAGLVRGTWFHEGLAREIECMRAEDARLHPHPFPPGLIAARSSARVGSVAELLRWERTDDLTAMEREQRYHQAQALLRFLVEREPGADFLERTRAVWGSGDEEIAALEPAWIAWLASLDALAAIRRGVRSTSESERAESAALLPILAEQGAAEVLSRGGDELALELMSDPAASSAAATFLMFFRAKQLTEADVATLSRSRDPSRCLTVQALRARRGERVDLAQAREAWARLAEQDRPSHYAQVLLIPGLLGR